MIDYIDRLGERVVRPYFGLMGVTLIIYIGIDLIETIILKRRGFRVSGRLKLYLFDKKK